MGGVSKKLNERMESVDQSFMDGISNVGGYIMGGLKNLLSDNPYEKNEETGEVVVKKSEQELRALENQARKDQQAYQQETTSAAFKKIDGSNNVANNSLNTANTESSTAGGPEVRPRKEYNLMSPTMIGGLGESAPKINIPTADEMKASGKKSSDKRMKLYDDSINTSKSRNRMGLFGNYGKDVTIKKTSNEVTGKVNREKFVDGKLVKSRFNNQEFKASKSKGNKNARQNRKNR